MEAPSLSRSHLRELHDKYPYASYRWNADARLFELWCDEKRGHPPYKFMDVAGPNGEYREPGGWCIDELRHSDAATGAWKLETADDRRAWIQSLEKSGWREKQQRERMDVELEQLRNSARFLNGYGAVENKATRTRRQYHMKRKLGG